MKTKVAISVLFAGLAALHLAYPTVKVDLPTLALLVMAALPWLASSIKAVELPGGFKIQLQDVKAATDKLPSSTMVEANQSQNLGSPVDSLDSLRAILQDDPGLALVGLRIEIEKRLRRLARAAQLHDAEQSAGALLRNLVRSGNLDQRTSGALADLIGYGNQAAHGAEVSREAAVWALDVAPKILGAIDRSIQEHPVRDASAG